MFLPPRNPPRAGALPLSIPVDAARHLGARSGERRRLRLSKHWWRAALSLLAGCSVVAATAAPAPAPGERVADIVQHQLVHGYGSKSAALARLQAAIDVPGPDANVEARRRYYAALGFMAADAQRSDLARTAIRELRTLASESGCLPCGAEAMLVEIDLAIDARDHRRVRELFQQLPGLPPAEKRVALRAELLRAQFESSAHPAVAMKHVLRGARLAEEIGDVRAQVNSLIIQNAISLNQLDIDRAAKLAAEAYAIAERHGMTDRMGAIRVNQAGIHAYRGEHELELAALRDALRIAESDPGMGELHATTLLNLAVALAALERPQEALEVARQAVERADRLGNPQLSAGARAMLGDAEIATGQVEQGLERQRQAIELARRHRLDEEVVQLTFALSVSYYDIGRYRESLAEMKRAMELQRAFLENEDERAVVEVQEAYAAERRNRDLQRLAMQARERQAEIDVRTWMLGVWATAAAALFLAATLLVQWVRSTRRQNAELESHNLLLDAHSRLDPLTGAHNRAHAERWFARRAAEPAAAARAVGLMLLDLDHFKSVNDRYGHATGDAVLVEVTRRLQGLKREPDVLVRWGGEELLLILPDITEEGLPPIAERVLAGIGGEPVATGGGALPVTTSAGCSLWPAYAGQTWQQALQLADLALYAGKAGGRNRAVCVLRASPDAAAARTPRDFAAARQQGGALEAVEIAGLPQPGWLGTF